MISPTASAARQLFNPFPGLRPFETRDTHLFFGRDGQSEELLLRLNRTRFVGVVGTSGSGKSSLVRAGLLPLLDGGFMTHAGPSWRVAVMRPGNGPIANLAAALMEAKLFEATDDDAIIERVRLEATLRRNALGLIEATRLARLGSENLLVVVDQFEELFTHAKRQSEDSRMSKDRRPGEERAAFVRLLLDASKQSEVPIYIVLTMRSDYLGDCAQFRDLPEALNDGQYLIPRMTRDQRRQAIVGPIAVAGGDISPRLVQHLLNDVGDDPDQLPVLQHALMRTWEYWESHHVENEPLDLAHYEAIGTLTEALSRHAEEAYASLSDDGARKIAEKIFKRLSEKGPDNREDRRPTTLATLAAVANTDVSGVVPVIEKFRTGTTSFLMPPAPIPLTADRMIDISHESLIRQWERLRRWVGEEAESRAMYLRVVDASQRYSRNQAGLWRDPDLKYALDWQRRQEPNPAWANVYDPRFTEAIRFLEESKQRREAEKARRRLKVQTLIAGLIVAFLLMRFGFLILPGQWRPGWNEPWPVGTPVPDTAGSWKLTELERKDGRFVALAISGGWSRAANFGAAVMLELQKRGLLEQVDVISGVSGGTLPAVYYGLGDKAGAFTEVAVREALGYDFQSSWLRRWFLPQNIFRYWLSDFTRSDIIVQVFNNRLFHKATFADLRPHPKILLNATLHNDNTRFTFTDDRFAGLHSVLAKYQVANAVNASSAFPSIFQDVTLQSYIEPPQYLHLYDGGSIDYLGVQAIVEYMNRNLLGISLDRLFPNGCLIIVVDAAPMSEYSELNSQSGQSFIGHFVDTNALDAMDAMLRESRRSLLARVGIPVEKQDQAMRGRLPVNDLHQCGCEMRHVALRQLLYVGESDADQELAERATRIKTKFWIAEEEQNDLFQAAKLLMKRLDDAHLLSDSSFKTCQRS